VTTPAQSYAARQAAVTRRTLIAAMFWLAMVGICILCDRVTVTACPGNSISGGAGVCADGHVRFGSRGLVWVILVALLGLAALTVAWNHARLEAAAGLPRERVGHVPRRVFLSRRMLGAICTLSVLGTLVAAHLILFAPQVDQPFCATTIRFGTSVHLGYPFNCDSPEFMRLANHPGALLDRDNVRQSRPLYVWAGAALTKSLGGVADATGLAAKYGQTDSAYIPLIVLNLMVEAAAVALLAILLWRCGAPLVGVLAVCLVLLSSNNMKAFFWTPHQQMFNSLVPLVAILYGGRLLHQRGSSGPLSLGISGLAAGLAGLMYGAFAIVAAVGAAAYLASRRMAGCRLRSGRVALALGSLALGFALPNIGWIVICRALSGGYYNQEAAQYHEFVWIPQHVHDGVGPFVSRIGGYAILELRSVFPSVGVPLMMLAAVALALLALSVPFIPQGRDRRAIVLACWLTLAVEVAFLYGIGVYVSRIAYLLTPPLLVLVGIGLGEIRDRAPSVSRFLELGIASGAVLFAGYQLMVQGPYS
jgi:hypothetical protein